MDRLVKRFAPRVVANAVSAVHSARSVHTNAPTYLQQGIAATVSVQQFCFGSTSLLHYGASDVLTGNSRNIWVQWVRRAERML